MAPARTAANSLAITLAYRWRVRNERMVVDTDRAGNLSGHSRPAPFVRQLLTGQVSKMFERQPVKVHLCCNDPDNGNFADRVWTIHIGENLELESKFWISFK